MDTRNSYHRIQGFRKPRLLTNLYRRIHSPTQHLHLLELEKSEWIRKIQSLNHRMSCILLFLNVPSEVSHLSITSTLLLLPLLVLLPVAVTSRRSLSRRGGKKYVAAWFPSG